MNSLPKEITKIIKKKVFTLNTITEGRDGGVDVKIRIQRIGVSCEKWLDENPINRSSFNELYVNIVVSGKITHKNCWGGPIILSPIEEVAVVKRNTINLYNIVWGSEHNKKIRDHIRNNIKNEIANYLKLFGISTPIMWNNKRKIKIKNISWGNV